MKISDHPGLNSRPDDDAPNLSTSFQWVSWLPFFALVAAIIITHRLQPEFQRESQALLTIIYTLFCTVPAILVALLAGYTFLVKGSLCILFLGLGAVFFSINYIATPLLISDYNIAVTVHNSGFLLSGLCFLLSGLAGDRARNAPESGRTAILALMYLTAVVAMTSLIWTAHIGVLPAFYIPGIDYTVLRYSILWLGVAAFGSSCLWYRCLFHRTQSRFFHWLSQTLALFMIAMAGAALIPAGGTTMSWVVRATQSIGGIYLFTAVFCAILDANALRIPLVQALRETEERLQLAMHAAHIGMWSVDIPSDTWEFSPETAHVLGLPPDEPVTYDKAFALTHPDDTPKVAETNTTVLVQEGLHELEYRIIRPDGAVRWLLLRGKTDLDPAGRPWRNMGIIMDISGRKYAEQSLRELNETLEQRVSRRTAEVRQQANQLRALANQLSRTEQTERKRLAEILHDHIQQLIVAARMQLDLLKRDTGTEQLTAIVQKIDNFLNEASEAARSLTVELRPPVLHNSGLTDGLKWLASRMQEQHQFSVRLRNDDRAEPASEETRFLLFECVRELLLNAVKHAGVNEAEITLMRSRNAEIKVSVSDEGTGFDPKLLKQRCTDEVSFGLFSVQERLTYLGGRMEIESDPGMGTKVTLFVQG